MKLYRITMTEGRWKETKIEINQLLDFRTCYGIKQQKVSSLRNNGGNKN